MDGAASSLQGGGGVELVGAGAGDGPLPACLPGYTAVENRAVSPSLSSFLCTSGVWGGGGRTGPCCAVLFCPWFSVVAGFLAWLRWSRFGFEIAESAHCCTHTDEPGSFGVVSDGY